MAEGKTIYAALLAIQQEIKAPKDQKGYGYEYRTADGIMQAAKPFLQEHGVICMLSDDVSQVGNRYYVKATATLIDIATGDNIKATGVAVEPDKLASMAPPQITGTASTYARKRALEGLFLLDNEKDVDAIAAQNAQNGAGRAQNGNANTYTNGNDKRAQNDAEIKKRQAAMERLKAEQKQSGLTWDEIKALVGLKFNKTKTSELSTAQIEILTQHMVDWAMEQSKAG